MKHLFIALLLSLAVLLAACTGPRAPEPVTPETPPVAAPNDISGDVQAVQVIDQDLEDTAVTDVEKDLEDFAL